MDESSISGLIIILALLALDALLTMAQTAVANSHSEYAGVDEDVFRRRSELTGQMGDGLLRFAMAVIAVNVFVQPLTLMWGDAVPVWGTYLIVMLPLAVIVIVFGDLLPEILGAAYAAELAPVLRVPLSVFMWLLQPLTALAYQISRLVVKLMGNKQMVSAITEEELLKLVDNDPSFEDDERKMIHSVLQLDETTVTEMMIPRIDIVALENTTAIADARRVFLESGHSRIPVYEENIDHIVGLCYVKDLLEVWHNGDTVVQSVAEIIRPVHFVPETMTADQLLAEFQLNKVHMVIVVEEYGGTAGLVTLENLLEEIVGDIQDEYDQDEEQDIVQVSETVYRVDAGVVLSELNDMLDVELDDEDVDTLGGFIFNLLERVPESGEVVLTPELELHIETVEGRRIRTVKVVKRDLSSPEAEAVDEVAVDELPASQTVNTPLSSDRSGQTIPEG